MTNLWDSLISASVLIGTFVGGLVLGYVTDLVGRRPMFTIDMITFLVSAVLMFFVTEPWHVFALGLVMGLAVGADYSIGSPLLGEFAPAHVRGNCLGVLEIRWNVGYVVAYLMSFVINTTFPGAWRITMAATAIPAIVCLVARHGLPESPRWLVSKGRRPEAEQILRDSMGPAYVGDLEGEEAGETRLATLFGPHYLRRTLFACIFWSAIVLPYFALTFFQPLILRALGLGDNALAGALLGVIIALAGAATGWYLVDRVGRRKILIIPMLACGVLLALAAAHAYLPTAVGALAFFGYLFSYGVMSILPGIYPEEVFPSSVRATGVGVATAASRAAAAVGTFLLPLVNASLGTPPPGPPARPGGLTLSPAPTSSSTRPS